MKESKLVKSITLLGTLLLKCRVVMNRYVYVFIAAQGKGNVL